MSKSANDVMQHIIFGAVVDAISAMRVASNGMPNTLLRDIATINANATFADLPKETQQAIRLSTKDAFNTLLKEGYAVALRSEVLSVKTDKRPPRRNDGGGKKRNPA